MEAIFIRFDMSLYILWILCSAVFTITIIMIILRGIRRLSSPRQENIYYIKASKPSTLNFVELPFQNRRPHNVIHRVDEKDVSVIV